MRPEAAALLRQRTQQGRPSLNCLPWGVPASTLFAPVHKIVQTPGLIVIMLEVDSGATRQIYTDGRKLPVDPEPLWYGYSVGKWVGDTLVVETAGFNDKSWLMTAMEPHTEEARLIERIRLVANGAFLENVVVVEDRHALTSAYTFTRYYKKQNGEMAEDVCNEDPEVWKGFRNDRLQKQIERLAHELKNPLFPLQITVENLQRARALDPAQFDEIFRESTDTLLAELSQLFPREHFLQLGLAHEHDLEQFLLVGLEV